MECSMVSTAVQPYLVRYNVNRTDEFHVNSVGFNGKRLNKLNSVSTTYSNSYGRWRVHCDPVSLEEEFLAVQSKNLSKDEEANADGVPQRPPTSEQLQALLANSERSNLIKKLSEANQYNRILKRQLQEKNSELVNFRSELAMIENEIQDLVVLAKEIANYSIPVGSRKINGKYIQSTLFKRLEGVYKRLEKHTKGVGASQLKEVSIIWSGMAESVQVMGSFDGWTQGEHLSPEYTGSYTTFSTKLKLKRGRYEIKFLVDGEWHLSPEFPSVGEGLIQNNLLIVD